MGPDKATILISDDDPQMLATLERAARRAGLRAICDSSSDVFTLAKRHRPSTILMDINQNVNGLELLRSLKSDPETRSIRVVMMSAIDSSMRHVLTRRDCLQAGADEFELKPLDPDFMTRLAMRVNHPNLDWAHWRHAAAKKEH
jgi:two-component system response regulator AdeR